MTDRSRVAHPAGPPPSDVPPPEADGEAEAEAGAEAVVTTVRGDCEAGGATGDEEEAVAGAELAELAEDPAAVVAGA